MKNNTGNRRRSSGPAGSSRRPACSSNSHASRKWNPLTAGASGQEFQMPNVLFVGSKVQLIQQMIQQREVVRGR